MNEKLLVFDCVPILPDWFFGLASQRKFSLAGRDWASNLSWSTDQKLKRDGRFTSPLVCGMTHRVKFYFLFSGAHAVRHLGKTHWAWWVLEPYPPNFRIRIIGLIWSIEFENMRTFRWKTGAKSAEYVQASEGERANIHTTINTFDEKLIQFWRNEICLFLVFLILYYFSAEKRISKL